MSLETKKTLRNQLIYSVFLRNHTQEGTFLSLIPDLDRIKELGTSIIWLLPIHPIGELNRKGNEGSPYAIQDYNKINPDYGTLDDLEELVAEIHKRDMKVIIDVVFNHTSPDSYLRKNHPEFFYRTASGDFGNKVADWADIIDLDYNNTDLWEHQIDTLKFWAKHVDGFRCDVASLVPLEFWHQARTSVATVNPDTLWLAETVEADFLKELREIDQVGLSDSEIYQVFDITYDYDVYPSYVDYLTEKISLESYISILNFQDSIYPENYIKMRFLENHDRQRAKQIIGNLNDLINWTAFLFFQKGIPQLYGGQERAVDHLPDLFVKDPVEWEQKIDLTPLIQRLMSVKKSLPIKGSYKLKAAASDTVVGYYRNGEQLFLGVFSLKSAVGMVHVDFPDGQYNNLLSDEKISVENGVLYCAGKPIILQK